MVAVFIEQTELSSLVASSTKSLFGDAFRFRIASETSFGFGGATSGIFPLPVIFDEKIYSEKTLVKKGRKNIATFCTLVGLLVVTGTLSSIATVIGTRSSDSIVVVIVSLQ